jgi:hypothetical protein
MGAYVAVPKTQDLPAEAFEKRGPGHVIRNGIEMLAAIKLHHDPCGPTSEVDDITTNGQLAREARVGMAKPLPEQAFLLRYTPAQGARFRSHVRGDARHILMLPSRHTEGNPPPPPPFQGGEMCPHQGVSRP